ncbi:MAG: hypothetical protein HC827_23775 [Cyanobacteria bacterium RM1_2_2]|nr:hypothetical protein [Cyanobacteria bacterium RM1_2_2]
MRTIISKTLSVVTNLVSSFKQIRVEQVLSLVLVGFLFLTANVPSEQRSEALGKAIRERIEATDQSDRPKTTGEFLDEARGDVPSDERIQNITRDSVEAFKELGKEYQPNLKAGAENLRDSLTQTK